MADDHLSDEEKEELQKDRVKAHEYLQENYVSMDLLDGIDFVDKIRSHFVDQENFKPPEIRQDLFKLHELVQSFVNFQSDPKNIDPIWEMAEDIETDLYSIQDYLDKLIYLIKPLTMGGIDSLSLKSDSSDDDDDEWG